jgi:ABC-type multidrug transport system ATPase subunit
LQVFWENLTVEEHIRIWRKLKMAAFQDTNFTQDDVLEECDLFEKAKAQARTLSGGQKRKLQLAICFTGGSSVCCVDEASSGLDPLSRRNIWNIIQKGHSRRTVLITTHFLDEADVLADHIAIMYKGKLVCEGPSTSLKSRFGGEYIVRSEPSGSNDEAMVWQTSTSSEAARKILELESLTNDHLRVIFPTLEKVFLNVTDASTAIHDSFGDGVAGDETVIDEKIFDFEVGNAIDIDLDVGHSIGVARQVITLFRKRYTLLLQRSGWLSYGVNLIIPIIIGAVLAHYVPRLPTLQTCQDNVNILHTQTLQEGSDLAPFEMYSPHYIYISSDSESPAALLGPRSAFTGAIQDDLYATEIGPYIYSGYSEYSQPQVANTTSEILTSRVFVNDTSHMIAAITNSSGYGFYGIAIWAPTPETAVIFHDSETYSSEVHMYSFSLITNRISNSTSPGPARVSSANLRFFTHVLSNVSFWSMPIAIILVLAFIAAASIAVIYPTFEKVNRVRALHYCNGVSPFALWFGYLLFDIQLIIIQSFIIWGVAFAGSLGRLYFAPSYILGVFLLFGIATYLGTYVLSLFIKKAAFAIAAGVHILLFILYLVGYIVNQAVGNVANRYQTYSYIQYYLGLTSPGANLARALFVSMNVFEVLCGEFGDDESKPMAYHRYGSVYANLLIQIVFLIALLVIYEYGSADWFRRHITHRGVPARLHYLVDSGQIQEEKHARASTVADPSKILSVSHVSKFFGRNFAAQNISFGISSNETLALLGANGAGKTTMINLIRGEMKPNFGDITLDGISVLRQPHKAKLQMGVCPQDDAVDNLTVRQTLSFYASVKGLKNVAGNVDKVLHALNITMYEHVVVKALSGGTKRKLSVAIALLGECLKPVKPIYLTREHR